MNSSKQPIGKYKCMIYCPMPVKQSIWLRPVLGCQYLTMISYNTTRTDFRWYWSSLIYFYHAYCTLQWLSNNLIISCHVALDHPARTSMLVPRFLANNPDKLGQCNGCDAPCVAKWSAVTLLIMNVKQVVDIHGKGFELSLSFQCGRMTLDSDLYLCFLTMVNAWRVNWLKPGNDVWHWRTWSTQVQVMARCLTAPSYHRQQCWLVISEVWWHSADGNFAGMLKIYFFI